MACAVIELVDELAENGLHQQQKYSSDRPAALWVRSSVPLVLRADAWPLMGIMGHSIGQDSILAFHVRLWPFLLPCTARQAISLTVRFLLQ